MAKHPENLHFGVYSQVEEGEHPDLSDIKNLRQEIVPAYTAQGPGFARNKVMEMYRNQDYFLQIDAHSLFVKDWDEKTINLYNKIKKETKNEKVVISFWGKPYMINQQNGKILYGRYEKGQWDVPGPHYTELVRYASYWIGGRVAMPRNIDYHESACALGGFIFAEGRIVEEVGYDPELAWAGEEVGFSLRAYCAGWNIYSPNKFLLYHNYERHNNPRVWNDKPDNWEQLQYASRMSLYDMILLEKIGKYALKDPLRLKEYEEKFYKFLTAEAKILKNKALLDPKHGVHPKHG